MHLAVLYFSLPFPAPKKNSRILVQRIIALKSQIEAPYETRLVDRLVEVANYAAVQGAGRLTGVGAASNEDRGNGVPYVDEVSVEVKAGHRGHMNVGDQACGFGETRGGEKISCRPEVLDSITQ
jgi:hypothetical protein